MANGSDGGSAALGNSGKKGGIGNDLLGSIISSSGNLFQAVPALSSQNAISNILARIQEEDERKFSGLTPRNPGLQLPGGGGAAGLANKRRDQQRAQIAAQKNAAAMQFIGSLLKFG